MNNTVISSIVTLIMSLMENGKQILIEIKQQKIFFLCFCSWKRILNWLIPCWLWGGGRLKVMLFSPLYPCVSVQSACSLYGWFAACSRGAMAMSFLQGRRQPGDCPGSSSVFNLAPFCPQSFGIFHAELPNTNHTHSSKCIPVSWALPGALVC